MTVQASHGEAAGHTKSARDFMAAMGLVNAGRFDDALKSFRAILVSDPDIAALWSDVGGQLCRLGICEEGVEVLKRAVELDPDRAETYSNLGGAYLRMNNLDVAVAAFKQALSLKPQFIDPYVNLIAAFKELGDLDQACIFAHAMLGLPDYSSSLSPNLLRCFREICDFDGLEKIGDVWTISDTVAVENLPAMFLDLLVYGEDPDSINKLRGLVDRWAKDSNEKAALDPLAPSEHECRQGKLRIGFLSSDLRGHSVAKFLMPLIRNYDHERFSFHCYTPITVHGDPVQQVFRDNADDFVAVEGLTPREIAVRIRQDGIDILLELNGFTKWNRTAVLAYKPACVQMSWLGYPFTCGLKAIDYVVMDRFVKPTDEDSLIEEPLVMPEAWVCHGSLDEEPITPNLPMHRNGAVTFGTLNSPYKYTPKMIALWAEVMKRVPDSRFLVVRPEVQSRTFCRNLTNHFSAVGITSDRLRFIDNKAGEASHLAYYNEIDITLDTFPLTGGTTTCDAIWMGVPVVTLVGDYFHQRISYSDLMQCGLEELCTFSPEEYVDRAVTLAGEHDKLRAWRHGLRDVMKASPLCDEERFVYQFQDMLDQISKLHGLR